MQRELLKTIREALDSYGHLTVEARRVRDKDDLFSLGLTCLAGVDVLLAIETALGIMLPASAMARNSVASIQAIADCIGKNMGQPLAA
jgi:acyl carrier protein